MIFQLAPLMDEKAAISKAINSIEFKNAKMGIQSSLLPSETRILNFDWIATQLVDVSISASIFAGDNSASEDLKSNLNFVKINNSMVKFRWDRLIIFIGLFYVIGIMLYTIIPGFRFFRGNDFESEKEPLSFIESFKLEVKKAEDKAEEFFSRSILILLSGIILSFLGVGIFYATLPDSQSDISISTFGIKVIRPTGVLMFVEAISWFLLRQYRALIEDYKWFYRLYLKKSSYLI